jgi:murein DD-endopeptidase MepM/ murein hydrolase activator NlpD
MLMMGGIMKYQKMLIVAAFLMLLASCGQLSQESEMPTPQTRSISDPFYLPIPQDQQLKITQGYHNGNYSIDMDNGTGNWQLAAIRGGQIIERVDGQPDCPGASCFYASYAYGNYLIIQHDDGTLARYAHMLTGTPTTKSRVAQGEVVGLAGSSGNADGIHVHLTVFSSPGVPAPPKFVEYGNGEVVPGTWRTSQNSEAVNPCPPACPPLSNEMILKAGATTALNFNLGDNVFNLFTTNSSDPDQLWDIFKPGDFGGNPGWMMRRKGTNICLNFYRPSLGNGVYPNPYACSASDGDQQFDFIDKGVGATGREWQIRVQGTNYCLDTANWASLARVYAYSCLETANQHWIIPAVPDPFVPPAWTVTPTAMTFTGTVGGITPDAQPFTIRNNGGAGTYGSWSSNDSWLGANGFNTTVGAGGTSPGNATVTACTAVGTSTGELRFESNNSRATISVTRVCNGMANWTPSVSSLTLPAGTVGGTTSSNTFILQNTGTASGTYTLSATSPFTINLATGTLANGSSAPITVTAPVCTVAGTQTSSVSIAGSISTVSVSRVCTVAVPTGLNLTVSSNGRIFVTWNESTGADQYEFAGTFDTNTPLGFSSGVNARGSGVNGAVLVWGLTPEDPAKQSKLLCVQIRAKNTGGSSNYTSPVCTTYKYYTGVSLKSSNPVVTISLP